LAAVKCGEELFEFERFKSFDGLRPRLERAIFGIDSIVFVDAVRDWGRFLTSKLGFEVIG